MMKKGLVLIGLLFCLAGCREEEAVKAKVADDVPPVAQDWSGVGDSSEYFPREWTEYVPEPKKEKEFTFEEYSGIKDPRNPWTGISEW